MSRLGTALADPDLDSPIRCNLRFSPHLRPSRVFYDRRVFFRAACFHNHRLLNDRVWCYPTVAPGPTLLDENFDVLAIFLVDHIDDLALCAALDIFDELRQVNTCQLGGVLSADLQSGIHQTQR